MSRGTCESPGRLQWRRASSVTPPYHLGQSKGLGVVVVVVVEVSVSVVVDAVVVEVVILEVVVVFVVVVVVSVAVVVSVVAVTVVVLVVVPVVEVAVSVVEVSVVLVSVVVVSLVVVSVVEVLVVLVVVVITSGVEKEFTVTLMPAAPKVDTKEDTLEELPAKAVKLAAMSLTLGKVGTAADVLKSSFVGSLMVYNAVTNVDCSQRRFE